MVQRPYPIGAASNNIFSSGMSWLRQVWPVLPRAISVLKIRVQNPGCRFAFERETVIITPSTCMPDDKRSLGSGRPTSCGNKLAGVQARLRRASEWLLWHSRLRVLSTKVCPIHSPVDHCNGLSVYSDILADHISSMVRFTAVCVALATSSLTGWYVAPSATGHDS